MKINFHKNNTTQHYYGVDVTYYTHNKIAHAVMVIKHDTLPSPYTLHATHTNKILHVTDMHTGFVHTMRTKYKTRITPLELNMLRNLLIQHVGLNKLYSLTMVCADCYASANKCDCVDCFGCTRFRRYNDFDHDNSKFAYISDTKISMVDYHMQMHTDAHNFCFDCYRCDAHCTGWCVDEPW